MGKAQQVDKSDLVNYYVSCCKFTVWVQCFTGKSGNVVIFNCAPLVSKFRGQYLNRLTKWAKTFGGFKIERI